VLGHESLGEVVAAPAGSGFAVGDRVVGIVRQPDPVPCPACAAGEWDMCRNDLYTEHGIKERDGFAAERFRVLTESAVKVDPGLGDMGVLLEPTSVVAKAWDHVERVGARARFFAPRTVVVSGAGPVGLLAALIGRQHGLDVHVLDRHRDGPKPELVRRLGATCHYGIESAVALAPDLWIECTGAPAVVAAAFTATAPAGILCLVGVTASHRIDFDLGAANNDIVLGNRVVFGSVNANRSHYERAAAVLAAAEPAWLESLITRRVPLSRFADAYRREANDIKVVIDFRG